MNGTDFLHMLLGAALVMLGVITAAFADRLRGLRISRRAPEITGDAPPVDILHAVPPAPILPRRSTRVEAKISAEGAEDVISALVAAGYKRPIATEATWACNAAQRVTIEDWTRAALRHCARRGMS